ncbi:tyrosine-type recombinase/integrase [Ferrimonas pelagia]|uniref:Tyr recombinase domain-containing protein n=1 Tax=Ferrimonas pelagia TaxID=1177826 RepID=A0ABP9FST4_9GAMM
MSALYHRNSKDYIKAHLSDGIVFAISLSKFGIEPTQHIKHLLEHIVTEVKLGMPDKTPQEMREAVRACFVRELVRLKRNLLGTGDVLSGLLSTPVSTPEPIAQQSPAPAEPVPVPPPVQPHGLTVRDIRKHWKEYRAENIKHGRWRVSTTGQVQQDNHFSGFEKTFLSALKANTVFDKALAREYRSLMQQLPQGWSKSIRYGKTIKEIIADADPDKTLGTSTVNQQMSNMGAFWRWMVNQDYTDKNVWDGLRIRAAKGKQRKSLDMRELNLLKATANADTGHEKFIPLLGMYTGARVGEIAQLRTDDVDLQARTIRITDGDGQQVKNETSRRTIPIPPQIEQEFIEYVEGVITAQSKLSGKDAQVRTLWPEVQGRTLNSKRNVVVRWFSYKYRDAIGETFHVLRHTFITELYRADARPDIIKDIVGHEQSGTTEKIYRKRSTVEQMREQIQLLPY